MVMVTNVRRGRESETKKALMPYYKEMRVLVRFFISSHNRHTYTHAHTERVQDSRNSRK